MRRVVSFVACLLLCMPAFAEEEPPGPPPQGPAAGPDGPGAGPDGGRGGRMRRMFERMLERFDHNDDGKVDRDELEGRAARMFDRIDRDGDGVLTKKDFEGRGGPEGRGERGARRGPGGTSTLSPQQVDTNRDNQITAAEWKAFHDKADKNGDGIVDKAEWDAAVSGGKLKDGAPAVGSAAPAVSAKRMGREEVVDLAKPKRTTVLIFGSHT